MILKEAGGLNTMTIKTLSKNLLSSQIKMR